jgi:predicted SAM-dependent methyltransferase
MAVTRETKRAPNGQCYLNVGCGSHFSQDWTNLDLFAGEGVIAHDLRQPLPFADASFDAVYSSHVLEHFVPADGERFLREQHRVLRAGGVCRVVVPDLEKLCREYLAQLDRTAPAAASDQVLDYQWAVLQLIDQMVREDCGGEMLKTLRERRFNAGYVRQQVGDEAIHFLDSPPSEGASAAPSALQGLKNRAKRLLGRDARGRGEAHRWMYDRVSLRLLLEKLGFSDVRVVSHLESSLPDWDKYALDTAQSGEGPRKPDSLFVEAVKSA